MEKKFDTLDVKFINQNIARVALNRPDKRNAMNVQLLDELPICFEWLGKQPELRVVILTGNGKIFSSGIDIKNPLFSMPIEGSDHARMAINTIKFIKKYQDSFSCLEKLRVPVIAAINSQCLGFAAELVAAADIRWCTQDTIFQFKEIDVGIAADLGLLQRIPAITKNNSWIRQCILSGQIITAADALNNNLVSKVLKDSVELESECMKLAEQLSQKSPIAIWTIKQILNHDRNYIYDNLQYMATVNSSMLYTNDIPSALQGLINKEQTIFSKI